MKPWDKWSKKELLSLPQRRWDITSAYDSILLVNTKQKHDSGYNYFAVIGCIDTYPVEIVGYMDDFRLGNIKDYEVENIKSGTVAIDCSMRGVFQIHSHWYKIVVGGNCSTTHFWFEEK